MGEGRFFLKRLIEDTNLTMEPLLGQSIVEIADDTRVLVENHLGVKAYGREKILIKVRYGHLCVSGCGLEILRMTKEQLVIRGKIKGVTLQRRRQA